MSVLIDPEDYDSSEQQFEASLASSPAARQNMEAPEQQREPAWNLVAAVAPAPARQEETNLVNKTPYWREEVTSRVESYRARRKRPPRERSLSLDFERAMNRAVVSQAPATSEAPVSSQFSVEACATAVAADLNPAGWEPMGAVSEERAQAGAAATEPEDSDDLQSEDQYAEDVLPDDRGLTSEDSNLIQFPRPQLIVMPPSSEELAEPVIDKPRILDAPEAVETAQAPLAGIQLEAEEDVPAVEFELPLVIAGMSRRAFAGLIDVLLVALASAVFLIVVLRAGATLPPGKAGAMLLLAAPILFWAVYEYLFLVHGGTTPGMRIARLELVSFEGEVVGRRLRRARALAMVLSCLSLGLGLLWALLDEDTLCWHDRISRTYMVSSC